VIQARMSIIVNVEHLKLTTLGALKALVDSDAMKVRYRKFKDVFETSLESCSLAGFERLNKDVQDA